MGEVMERGVIGMPFDMAMGSELSQRQFYSMAQRILADRDRLAEESERLRAQPAEAEGVEVVAYVGCQSRMTPEGWENGDEYLVFADQASDADKRYDVPLMTVVQHLAALSAVTAERDRLDMECGRLLEGKVQDAETIFVLEAERDQLRAEVEALRKDAERITFIEAHWFYSPQGDGWSFGYNEDWEKPGATLRDAIDAAMAAKEA